MNNIFVYCDKGIRVTKINVSNVVKVILKKLIVGLENLEINFVDKKTITKINRMYLKHDYATDVISFNYSDESNILDGEIFICLEIAKENAYLYNVSLDNECKRLITHGILHLVGFKDKTKLQKQKMTRMENIFLKDIVKLPRIIK